MENIAELKWEVETYSLEKNLIATDGNFIPCKLSYPRLVAKVNFDVRNSPRTENTRLAKDAGESTHLLWVSYLPDLGFLNQNLPTEHSNLYHYGIAQTVGYQRTDRRGIAVSELAAKEAVSNMWFTLLSDLNSGKQVLEGYRPEYDDELQMPVNVEKTFLE